jgi:hypothetical protein
LAYSWVSEDQAALRPVPIPIGQIMKSLYS